MMDSIEHLISAVKKRFKEGQSPDEIIVDLHSDGVSMVDSIKIIRFALKVSLGSAKKMVTGNDAWARSIDESQPFYDELMEVAEQLKEEELRTTSKARQ